MRLPRLPLQTVLVAMPMTPLGPLLVLLLARRVGLHVLLDGLRGLLVEHFAGLDDVSEDCGAEVRSTCL